MSGKRGPKIRPEIRHTIYTKALESKLPRQKLAIEIQELLEKAGEIVPKEDTISKLISEARNSPDSLDYLWSGMALSLPECSIPPDTLPVVYQVWAYAYTINTPLTIREALWVSRLCYVIRSYKFDTERQFIQNLWLYAKNSAFHERILIIENKIEKKYPNTREAITEFWMWDASLYSLMNSAEFNIEETINREFNSVLKRQADTDKKSGGKNK